MPVKQNLSGRQLGELLVIREVGFDDSKKSPYGWLWLCRCQRCGREEVIHQGKLPYRPSLENKRGVRYACTVCMRGPCVICNGEIIADTYNGVCSEACHLERVRQQNRNYHYRKQAADPDYSKKVIAKRKARREKNDLDPEKREARLEKEREKSRIRRELHGDRINAVARKHYAIKKERVQQRRKELLAEKTPEQLAELLERTRQYRRDYWVENRDWITKKREAFYADDTKRIRRNTRNRTAWRAKKAQERLGALMSNMARALERSAAGGEKD